MRIESWPITCLLNFNQYQQLKDIPSVPISIDIGTFFSYEDLIRSVLECLRNANDERIASAITARPREDGTITYQFIHRRPKSKPRCLCDPAAFDPTTFTRHAISEPFENHYSANNVI